jgi:hypothetical protein
MGDADGFLAQFDPLTWFWRAFVPSTAQPTVDRSAFNPLGMKATKEHRNLGFSSEMEGSKGALKGRRIRSLIATI